MDGLRDVRTLLQPGIRKCKVPFLLLLASRRLNSIGTRLTLSRRGVGSGLEFTLPVPSIQSPPRMPEEGGGAEGRQDGDHLPLLAQQAVVPFVAQHGIGHQEVALRQEAGVGPDNQHESQGRPLCLLGRLSDFPGTKFRRILPLYTCSTAHRSFVER